MAEDTHSSLERISGARGNARSRAPFTAVAWVVHQGGRLFAYAIERAPSKEVVFTMLALLCYETQAMSAGFLGKLG